MTRTPWCAIAACVATAAFPMTVHAQRVSYLRSLAVPPQSVGSCGPAPAPERLRADAPVNGLDGRQLELTAEQGAIHRTLIVYTDRRGRPRQFAEMTVPGAGAQSSASAEVEATVDSVGHVRGFLLHHTGAARGSAHHSRRALTAAERREVRDLAAWMIKRCRT